MKKRNKKRLKSGDPSDRITGKLLDNFGTFLDLVPAGRLSQNIRKLLFSFLTHEVEGGVDNDFDIYIKDLRDFFEFLDAIEAECDQSELLNEPDTEQE